MRQLLERLEKKAMKNESLINQLIDQIVYRHIDEAKKKSWLEKFKEKHGIVSQKAEPDHVVHSIGFSEKEKKWYGWSHRAIASFGVGDKVKDGHSPEKYRGKTARSLMDCEKFARAFAAEVS